MKSATSSANIRSGGDEPVKEGWENNWEALLITYHGGCNVSNLYD